jgi:hypothetical protein
MAGDGTKLANSNPHSSSCASHSLSFASVLRPGTRSPRRDVNATSAHAVVSVLALTDSATVNATLYLRTTAVLDTRAFQDDPDGGHGAAFDLHRVLQRAQGDVRIVQMT